MERLTRARFEAGSSGYDAAVARAEEIDRYCTSADWILAAADAWPGGGEFLAGRRGADHVVLQSVTLPSGRVLLLPLEHVWGFASPLVGAGSPALLRELCAGRRWDLLLLNGIPPKSRLLQGILDASVGRWRPEGGITRRRADITGGLGGYLSRRTPHFRKQVRETLRRAARAGITFERVSLPPDPLIDRLVAIEARSWKGAASTGLFDRPLQRFYRALAARLHASGSLRLLLARQRGSDVGYVLGGVAHGIYRGFQFSYDQAFARLSLGNALQVAQIDALAAEGVATYDLGMDMEYKRRFAEQAFDTLAMVAVNPTPPPAPSRSP